MPSLFWYSALFVGVMLIVGVVFRYLKRHSYRGAESAIRQLNCPHPYTYYSNRKKLCAKCGKPMLDRRFEDIVQ